MQGTLRKQFVSVLLVASFFLTALSQADAAPRHRIRRNANLPQQTFVPTVESRPLSTELFLSKLTELCDQAKADVQNPGDKELELGKARLLKATNELLRTIDKDPNRESAELWKERLDLVALQAALADDKPLDYPFLEKAWKKFNADEEGINWAVFGTVRSGLQSYLVLQTAVASKSFDKNLPLVCVNLVQSVEKYLKTADVQDATAVSDVLGWLDAFAPYRSNLNEIVQLVRKQFSGVNVQIQAALPFIAAGFRESFDEEFEIVENMSGTMVRGTGNVSGSSNAALVPRNDLVELKLLVNAEMVSKTTASHPPVTLNNLTSGTLYGTKSILFSPERIWTTPAGTRADLNSTITGMRINGCRIIQCIAKQQVAERRPAAEAEARRRAEQRLSERIDRQVDETLAELSGNYQEKFRKPLLEIGFFPRLWKYLTTEEFVNVATIFANASQTTTSVPPPNQDLQADLIVRIHQSALNNAASVFLGGRTFYEDQLVERFKDQSNDLPKLLQRKEGDVAINPTFALNNPVSVSFVDNKIKAVFRIADFNLEQKQVKQQSDITFLFGVKIDKQKGADGKERTVVVFEQLEKPKATAPGKTSISATEMPVQRRVMTRLEESVQKKIELQPRELKGRWEGAGKIVPVFASTENGWLTLAWNWVPAE